MRSRRLGLLVAVVSCVALAGCATSAGDAGPSTDPAPVDASPSPVASTDPTTTGEPEQGGDRDPDASTQYILAFCPTLVLEDALLLSAGDAAATGLGPARTTTAAAASDAAERMLADWIEWSDASLELRTRLSTDLQAYADALLLADVDGDALAAVVLDQSPLDGIDSATLRVEVGLNPDLDVACSGG
ncbi:hypothetical protein [Agrococcus jejuensis]|uniref:hypothetical protein n=1 Tax=Agrococcus jejuensis TaxID=399736 RepID=UPI0011A5019A|nr:hypothetical protein [Agrococcus jejuensis]